LIYGAHNDFGVKTVVVKNKEKRKKLLGWQEKKETRLMYE